MDSIADKPAASNPIEEHERRADKNLRLWRLNETTDPAHTKPVTIGRKFTSIDGYYQIKRATETFGPIGIGWGWNLQCETISVDGAVGACHFAKCVVTLWYVDEDSSDRVYCGPVVGMNQLVSKAGVPDDEAFKKATTDGITKALSYLGFSADVFMGLYDDNKYMARIRDEFSKKAETTKNKLPEVLVRAVEGLPKVMDLKELNIVWRALKDDLKKLPPAQLDYMQARFAMRKRQLGGGEPEARHGDDPGDDNGGEPRGDLHTGGPTTQP